MKNLFKVDPLKSFTELPLFWITIITFFMLALISTILIISNSNLDWGLDYKGFNSLVEIFKIPLSLMAIAITIIAILATIHRSAQTREQLVITQKQNVFSNYFKHIEEFEKYFDTAISKKTMELGNLRFTHKYLYPDAFEGDYRINEKFISIVSKEFSTINDLLNELSPNNIESVFGILNEIYHRVDNVFSLINLKIKRSGKIFAKEGNKIIVPNFNITSVIRELQNTSLILRQILSFDRLVIIPSSLNQLADIKIYKMDEWSFFNG